MNLVVHVVGRALRFGFPTRDDFKETEHPRAKSGQFAKKRSHFYLHLHHRKM